MSNENNAIDMPGHWSLTRYACPVSMGLTEKHGSLIEVMLSILNMIDKGWLIFEVKHDDKGFADVFVRPDKSDAYINLLNKHKEYKQ